MLKEFFNYLYPLSRIFNIIFVSTTSLCYLLGDHVTYPVL